MGSQKNTDRSRESPPSRRRRSLRLRLSGWIVGIFTATLAVFTAAGIVEERRQILRNEIDQARAFVEHVARMPEFGMQSTFGEAAPHLASIRGLLRAGGADLEMAPRARKALRPSAASTELTTGVLAAREISIADGTFELVYRKDPERFRQIAARSVLIHVLHGILALATLLAGTEWILRRQLLAPLAKISHQVNHMRRGGGWLTILPRTDTELEGLAGAVKDLGPGLEGQVQEWIDAERRAAVALCLITVRSRIRAPILEVRAQAADLQARDLVLPEGKKRLRALVAATDRLGEAMTAADQIAFAPDWSSEAGIFRLRDRDGSPREGNEKSLNAEKSRRTRTP